LKKEWKGACVERPLLVDIRQKEKYSLTVKSCPRPRAMTIAIGMRCIDGIVLCADQEITGPSGVKYYEEKIHVIEGRGWVLALTYADSTGLMKEAQKKILDFIGNTPDIKITPEAVYKTAESILIGMGRQQGDLNLQLLIAISTIYEGPEMFMFNGSGFHRADGFNCLGVGDSSLIRYLSKPLYSSLLATENAKNVGIYLVAKATQCIAGCGGPINMAIIKPSGIFMWLVDSEIHERRSAMESVERENLIKIIESGG
jgi:20S proteasome alpha/beta subunit